MKVLVVGGAGYIGGVTTLLLEEAGHEAVVFDNLSTGHAHNLKKAKLIKGDILDRKALTNAFKTQKFDAVLCFAAKIQVEESVREPWLYYTNNSVGALNVIDAAAKSGVNNFIFSSTAAVYGEPAANPIDESAETSPINPYGISKLLVEQMLYGYELAYKLNWVAFRYFNATGAYGGIGPEYPVVTHLISKAVTALQTGKTLDVFGTDYPTKDGTAVRDFVHVADIARAHVIAAEQMVAGKKMCQPINLGSGRGYSVLEVLAAIEKAAGKKIRRRDAMRRAGDPAELIAGNARAKKVLGWTPEYDLERIVSDALQWHEKLANK